MRQIQSAPALFGRGLLAGLALLGLFACGDDGGDTDSSGSEGASGEPFSPPEGGYSAVFPGDGEPQRQEQPTPLPDGSTMTAIFYIAEDDDRGYITSQATMPEQPADVQQSLEGARDGAISGSGGTLGDSNPVELQGVPGIEFSATVTSNGVDGTLVARFYLDGDKQFQVFVTGPGTFDASDEQVQAFLDSYEFVE